MLNKVFCIFFKDLSSQHTPALTYDQQEILNKARNFVNEALELDESGKCNEALQQYIHAVEVAANAVRNCKIATQLCIN